MGWIEMSGVIPVNREEDFGIKEEEILAIKKKMRINPNLIQALKKSVTKKLAGFI